MTDINKQKFLTELGKLLTFMYEEDRQQALAMYGRMFDQTADEQALLQFLVSPTRQAVVIARAYNARERKLQVNSQSRENAGGGDSPDFARAIEALEEEALSRNIIAPEVPAEQFTLFADGIHPVGEAAEAGASSAGGAAAENINSPDTSSLAEAEAVPLESEPEPENSAASPDAKTDGAENISAAAAAETAETAETAPEKAAETSADSEGAPAQNPSPAVSEDADVDAFLSEFSIADNEFKKPEAEEGAAACGVEAENKSKAADKVVPVAAEVPAREPDIGFTPDMNAEKTADAVSLTVRKPVVPLLILYIIIAVPLTALCVLVLLIPTFLALSLAAGSIGLGCAALTTAFGSFTIFADVMVVLGAALVGLALGLLFLWLFVWFIGGAIAGLINGVIKLGGKWCYKEVSAA